MDGAVTNLAKEEGEMVIGAQSFQPTVIMTVADLSVMVVEILVDETDIAHVKLGQSAEVRVDALEGAKISGEVTEIGSSAIPRGTSGTAIQSSSTNTGNQAKDFKVTVTLKDPPKSLRPGLNATADITTARKEKALSIPIQAVVVRAVDEAGKVIDPAEKEQEGSSEPVRRKGEEKEGVFVVKDGAAAFKPVKTGIVGETEIEVAEGLAEGDELVVGSYRTLRTLKDQAKIRVETKKEKS
jgi:HlyD family secretion protein